MNSRNVISVAVCVHPSHSRMWPGSFCYGLGLPYLVKKAWIRLQIKFILLLACLCQKGGGIWIYSYIHSMNSENIHVLWMNLCMGSIRVLFTSYWNTQGMELLRL